MALPKARIARPVASESDSLSPSSPSEPLQVLLRLASLPQFAGTCIHTPDMLVETATYQMAMVPGQGGKGISSASYLFRIASSLG